MPRNLFFIEIRAFKKQKTKEKEISFFSSFIGRAIHLSVPEFDNDFNSLIPLIVTLRLLHKAECLDIRQIVN